VAGAFAAVAGVAVTASRWDAPPSPQEQAVAAADDFLDRYLMTDGRVTRPDQRGDTVSEGQAYAMLLAAATSDEERFRLAWGWTDANLRRDDGLFAWRWADGAVVDEGAAADADLLVAGALAIAGQRFDDAGLVDAARRTSAAVLAAETFLAGEARVLAAGPWAVPRRTVNPSYLVVGMMSHLWWTASETRAWAPVAATSRELLDELTAAVPHLPPDWATVSGDGTDVRAAAAPSGEGPRYGYDALRVLVQLAVDCDRSGQSIAARPWSFLRGEVGDGLAVAYDLEGGPVDTATHPAALVAAAASAAAAGDGDAAGLLLDVADDLDARHPTYYGAAWVALGRVWLDTDLLGGCRPGHPRSQ
jgi:endoglucanase